MKTNSIMQVIFRGAYWLRSWAQLQRDEQAKDTLTLMSKKLEIIQIEGGSTCIVCFSPFIFRRLWFAFFTENGLQ
jgi:hypothetical protein